MTKITSIGKLKEELELNGIKIRIKADFTPIDITINLEDRDISMYRIDMYSLVQTEYLIGTINLRNMSLQTKDFLDVQPLSIIMSFLKKFKPDSQKFKVQNCDTISHDTTEKIEDIMKMNCINEIVAPTIAEHIKDLNEDFVIPL